MQRTAEPDHGLFGAMQAFCGPPGAAPRLGDRGGPASQPRFFSVSQPGPQPISRESFLN